MKPGKRVLCVLMLGTSSLSAQSAYAPLQLYNGNWRVTRKDSPKPDELKNECALIGKFYTCQQTVNGDVSALLIFVPAGSPGHYFTQSVNTQGRAEGRGDLQISGDRWVYSSTWDEGGKTTYYQTINVFSGRDHIHFEQQQSSNRKDWTTSNSGDETRLPPGR
jgi:hypothetical protein